MILGSTQDQEYLVSTLENDIAEWREKRVEAMSELGACLYEQVKDDPTFVGGREELFGRIDAIDTQINKIAAEIEDLKNMLDGGSVKRCSCCRAVVDEDDAFCRKCGFMLEGMQKPACPNCGKEFEEADKFCAYCGTPITHHG